MATNKAAAKAKTKVGTQAKNAIVKPTRVAQKAVGPAKAATTRTKGAAAKPKKSVAANTRPSAKRSLPRYMPKVDFVTFFSSFSEAELKAVERIYDFLPSALQDAIDAESVRRSAGQRLVPAREVLAKLR